MMRENTDDSAYANSAAGSDGDDSILIVDDDASVIDVMAHTLAGLGNLRFATNGVDALRLVHESAPDLILLDAEMPGMSGFQLFAELKAQVQLADVPVIFVTSHSEAAFEVSSLDMGASDFIAKPFTAPLVIARVRTHLRAKHLSDRLRRIATTDALTGVSNRRGFDELLDREWRRSRRDGSPLSLLLIDVDHFKLFNDRYGHPKGDVCLRRLAQALSSICRRAFDFVARCGGEEFMVLLPATNRAGAENAAQRVLTAVESLNIRHEDSPTARLVTVSIGGAYSDEQSASWAAPGPEHRMGSDMHERCSASDLVIAADKAMYRAKNAGRAQARFLDIDESAPPERVPTTLPREQDGRRTAA